MRLHCLVSMASAATFAGCATQPVPAPTPPTSAGTVKVMPLGGFDGEFEKVGPPRPSHEGGRNPLLLMEGGRG